jgi:hypothetical protein
MRQSLTWKGPGVNTEIHDQTSPRNCWTISPVAGRFNRRAMQRGAYADVHYRHGLLNAPQIKLVRPRLSCLRDADGLWTWP